MTYPSLATAPSAAAAAAAKVLAIPELLEHILVLLGSEVARKKVPKNAGTKTRNYKLEPATTIARCRMVDRTFYVNITASTKLQRMLEYTSPADIDAWPSQALHWLFNRELGLHTEVDYVQFEPKLRLRYTARAPTSRAFAGTSILRRSGQDLLDHKQHYEILLQRKGSPEASWRCIKLSSIFDLVVFRLSGSGVGAEFTFNGQQTLGSIFDGYGAVLEKLCSIFESAWR